MNQPHITSERPDSEHRDNELHLSTQPQEVEATPMTTPGSEQQRRVGLGTKIVGGIAGAAVLVGGGLFAGEKLNHHDGPATADPSAEAPVVPGQVIETTAPANTTPTPTDLPSSIETLSPEQLTIPAGLGDYQLGQTLMARLQAWENAGAPQDDNAAFYKINLPNEAAAAQLTDENGQAFADALMAAGWQTDPVAVKFVDTMKVRNKATILGANVALGRNEAPTTDTYAFQNATAENAQGVVLADPTLHIDRALLVDYTWSNSTTGDTSLMHAGFDLQTINGQERIVEVYIRTADGQQVVGK